jgi:hypothetical protein
LLEYWRRVNKRERQAAKGKSVVEEEPEQQAEPRAEPLTEAEAESQFAQAQAMFEMGGRIPEHLREAIRWAEAEKEKRGIKLN